MVIHHNHPDDGDQRDLWNVGCQFNINLPISIEQYITFIWVKSYIVVSLLLNPEYVSNIFFRNVDELPK
jgi:hypothetical protein